MSTRSLRRRLTALAVGGLLLAGCTSTPAPTSDAGPASSPASRGLDWKPCDGAGAEWRCATARVPLDHAKPAGATLGVALIRKEATDRKKRIGSLLFNFGGPGASGVEMLPQLSGEYASLGERYDLVGFDPRGVGRSSGVVCRDDAEQAAAEATVDSTPDTPAEEAAYLKDAAAFGAGCARRSGTVIPYTTTSATARDLDLIRQALGDEKLHYFGISYGTQLGGTYAHLFPRKVGRLVLDAVVDPTADAAGHARHQTVGFQRALDNYLKSTGQTPEAGTARITTLLAALDRRPLKVGDRLLTEGLATTGIAVTLYAESSWPLLTEALGAAEAGDGGGLLRLADAYNDRDEQGRYATGSHSQRAISCADSSERPTAARAKALLPEFRRLSPVFGAFLAWDTAGWCAGWPVKGEARTPAASAPGADPVLVVGTTGDPATPYEGAERMAEELGEGVGILVTNKGEGHGAYGTSPCVTRTVDAYLLDGKVPAFGTTCG
ncbi:alpha/beta hydrolase [Streptomyces sp. R302]|uniref:alpha/beta hydrolase n=1 Tax=unclassified Streptomyces TaxID=2593676 RepID=UPI00145DC60D|nr:MULTISPECIES: alpha/beta hydrolase [unclassified Streptomyces]NML52792.1 alpha/beta hydrolase [Streptomyces sp. R301]NML78627.1 alpha/beta hydrolase [Streptomyces sp. R302]